MSKFYSAETQQGHSPHFFHFIKRVGEATSKQQCDEVVVADLKDLKHTLSSQNIDTDYLKEYAVRAYYAELLGHSAEFAHVFCINLTSNSRLICKRTAYLATWRMVHPDSELMYLLVSSVQRDLHSRSYLEVAAALSAAAKLLRPELMSVIQPELTGLLLHEKPLIRRKVVEAMHAFYLRSDGSLCELASFRQALCDREPSVMDAAVRLLHDVILRDTASQHDLLDSFIFILTQVIERRLPRQCEYHRMPAPWLQIRLIQVITIIVGTDKQRAEKAERVFAEVMKRADNGKLIGFAVISEVIRSAAAMPVLPLLLRLASEAVSGLLNSSNPNLRCAGIQGLSYMVCRNRHLAVQHQEVVMQCLEDDDETIRRKAIWLLFAICDRHNIRPIARRLIQFIAHVTDPFWKRSTTRSLCRLMEQHASKPWWYITAMNRLLTAAPECVLPEAVQKMLRLIAEGQGEGEAVDVAFRVRCVELYFNLTGGVTGASGVTREVPETLKRIGAWVMGEYGFLAEGIGKDMLLNRLCDILEQSNNSETRCWTITAIAKVAASHGSLPDDVVEMLRKLTSSRHIAVQQRCYELLELLKTPELMRQVLPLDGFCEEVVVDASMPFLDGVVRHAIASGAQRYQRPERYSSLQIPSSSTMSQTPTLRTGVYTGASPNPNVPRPSAQATMPSAEPKSFRGNSSGIAQSIMEQSEVPRLNTTTTRWGNSNLREAEAVEEELHLQVSAAAAVGGGGVVWGMHTDLISSPTHSVDPNPAVSTPTAVKKRADEAANSYLTTTSGKSAKFMRSIFGGSGRRRHPLRGSSRSEEAPKTAKPLQLQSRRSEHYQSSGVTPMGGSEALEALFPSSPTHGNCDTTVSHGTPLTQDPQFDFFHRDRIDPLDELLFASPASAAIPEHLQQHPFLRPAPEDFTIEEFGRLWGSYGSAKECARQLHLPGEIVDYTSRNGYLQQHLRRTAALRVIQVIGKELIAAAMVATASNANQASAHIPSSVSEMTPLSYALVHLTTINAHTATATVRSDERESCIRVLDALQELPNKGN